MQTATHEAAAENGQGATAEAASDRAATPIEQRARALAQKSMELRLQAATRAAEAARARDAAAEQLTRSEADYLTAWREVVEAGWTERELKEIGLTPPSTGKRGPARAGKRAAATRSPRASDAGQ